MSHGFDSYRVPDLQYYLRNRGVTVTGYNKGILKESHCSAEVAVAGRPRLFRRFCSGLCGQETVSCRVDVMQTTGN